MEILALSDCLMVLLAMIYSMQAFKLTNDGKVLVQLSNQLFNQNPNLENFGKLTGFNIKDNEGGSGDD